MLFCTVPVVGKVKLNHIAVILLICSWVGCIYFSDFFRAATILSPYRYDMKIFLLGLNHLCWIVPGYKLPMYVFQLFAYMNMIHLNFVFICHNSCLLNDRI